VRVLRTKLPEIVLVEPSVHGDERGFFVESYHASRYRDAGIDVEFVQDNHSLSKQGTLRGLHAQLGSHAQGKLVRVTRGEVYDVAVDIRRGSPTFGCYEAARLSAENFLQLYIPPGFAHGFVVTSEVAEFQYKCSEFYDRESEISIAWNDPQIGIPWPVSDPQLSPKDAEAPALAECMERLPRYSG
jgi:dTDP-4-dehydrorhamnose 3,5-epimerase